jgi:hypothetical protein
VVPARVGGKQPAAEVTQVSDPGIGGGDPPGKAADVDRADRGGDEKRPHVDDHDIGATDRIVDLAGELRRVKELAGLDSHPRLGLVRPETSRRHGRENFIPGDARVAAQQSLPDESDTNRSRHAKLISRTVYTMRIPASP